MQKAGCFTLLFLPYWLQGLLTAILVFLVITVVFLLAPAQFSAYTSASLSIVSAVQVCDASKAQLIFYRWVNKKINRIDPLTDEYPYLTPYQYAGCEPIANTDLDGAEPKNATQVDSRTWVSEGKYTAGEIMQQKLGNPTGWLGNTKDIQGVTVTGMRKSLQPLSSGNYVVSFLEGAGEAFTSVLESIKALPQNIQKSGWWINMLAESGPLPGLFVDRFVDNDGNRVGFFDKERAAMDFIENADGHDWAKLSGRLVGELVKAAVLRKVGSTTMRLAPSSVANRLPGFRPCAMCVEEQAFSMGGKYDGLLVGTSYSKGVTKTDILFNNRSEAMNWIRNELGHNTSKIRTVSGKVVGWENSIGKTAYWKHGDWYKGKGSSTFPHLNYNFGNIKGHLFLKDKIINSGMKGAFNNHFGSKFIL